MGSPAVDQRQSRPTRVRLPDPGATIRRIIVTEPGHMVGTRPIPTTPSRTAPYPATRLVRPRSLSRLVTGRNSNVPRPSCPAMGPIRRCAGPHLIRLRHRHRQLDGLRRIALRYSGVPTGISVEFRTRNIGNDAPSFGGLAGLPGEQPHEDLQLAAGGCRNSGHTGAGRRVRMRSLPILLHNAQTRWW